MDSSIRFWPHHDGALSSWAEQQAIATTTGALAQRATAAPIDRGLEKTDWLDPGREPPSLRVTYISAPQYSRARKQGDPRRALSDAGCGLRDKTHDQSTGSRKGNLFVYYA